MTLKWAEKKIITLKWAPYKDYGNPRVLIPNQYCHRHWHKKTKKGLSNLRLVVRKKKTILRLTAKLHMADQHGLPRVVSKKPRLFIRREIPFSILEAKNLVAVSSDFFFSTTITGSVPQQYITSTMHQSCICRCLARSCRIETENLTTVLTSSTSIIKWAGKRRCQSPSPLD